MLKKLLASIFITIFVLIPIFTPVVHAQQEEVWYNQSFKNWSDKVFDENSPQEIFGERFIFFQVQGITYSLAAIAAGTDIIKCASSATTDINQFKSCVENLGPVTSGSSSKKLDSITSLAFIGDVLLTTHPASGVSYIVQSASKLHLIPTAYAQNTQGFGFRSLEPILKIWKAFRNMAYLLSILVILVMAFMIMFRVKISPQTVITVQSALPRLVMVLILITFSYAIAGLLVDLSYLIIALIALFAKSQGLAGITPSLTTIELAQRMWSGVGTQLSSLVLLVTLPLVLLLGVGGAVVGGILGTVTLPGIGTVGAGGLGFIVGVVALLVIIVVIIWTLFRILWTMLKALVNIVLLTIFGPLLILLGGISNNVGGFGVWFRNLAANIAVFPTISIMAFIAHLIFWGPSDPLHDLLRNLSWINPFGVGSSMGTSNVSLPLLSMSTVILPVFIALGILFLMPSAAELIKSIIQGQPFNYGTAIGQAFAPLGAAWGMTGAPVVGMWRELQTAQTTYAILNALKRAPGLEGVSGYLDRLTKSLQEKYKVGG